MILALLLATADPCAPAAAPLPEPPAAIRRAVGHALVEVEHCTGFVVGQAGLVMTAAHCLPARGKPVLRVGGTRRHGRVLYADFKEDVAVLAAPEALYALPPLVLRAPGKGEPRAACRTGYPRGRLETVCGAVVGRARLEDGAIRLLHLGGGGGGDSGSPLFDPETGEVLGVHAHEFEGVADAADAATAAAALDEALEAARSGRPVLEGESGRLAAARGEPATHADALKVIAEADDRLPALARLAEAMWSVDAAWSRLAAGTLARRPAPVAVGGAAGACAQHTRSRARVLLLSGEDPEAIRQRVALEAEARRLGADVLSLPAGRRIGWTAVEGRKARPPSGPEQAVDERLLGRPDLVLALVGERALLAPTPAQLRALLAAK